MNLIQKSFAVQINDSFGCERETEEERESRLVHNYKAQHTILKIEM